MLSQNYSFDSFLPIIEEFESLCHENAINLKGFTSYFKLVERVIDIYGKYKGELKNVIGVDVRQEIIETVGLIDFLYKILKVRNHSDFPKLIGHLRLFSSNGKLIQNYYSESTDSDTNKLFELFIAVSCMTFANDFKIEDPIKSPKSNGGRNPDIIFKYNNIKIGIACKVISSPSFKSYVDLVQKGSDQISKANEVELGFTVVNMKNLINYNDFWPIIGVDHDSDPIIGTYIDKSDAYKIIDSIEQQYRDNLPFYFGDEENRKHIFYTPSSLPMSFNYYGPVCGILDEFNRPVPTLLRKNYLHRYLDMSQEINTFVKEFIFKFDESLYI